MNWRRGLGWAACGAVALTTACATYGYPSGYDYTSVDGSYGAYVENLPSGNLPLGIEYYPRYRVQDGYVYAANGRYYYRDDRDGRWVVYRSAPPAIRDQRPE